MTTPEAPPDQPALAFAERIARILGENSIDAVLVGAAAMAAHGYVRSTEDIDFGTAVETWPVMSRLPEKLAGAGLRSEFFPPEPEDPLGGVVRIAGEDGSSVDVINFYNPSSVGLRNVVRDAIAKALPADPSSALKLIPLSHLIALKLYAGPLAWPDVRALLREHPELDLAELRRFLEQHQLHEHWDRFIAG